MTDARRIKLLRAAIRRAMVYLPGPVVAVLVQVLELTM